MATSSDPPGARLATRLVFFIIGLASASWAPLVPYAKDRVGANDAQLGLVLLCLGLGSIVSMPIAGGLVGRRHARDVILVGAAGAVIALPLLAIVPTMPLLALSLLLFGASLGLVDISINVHAAEVQKAAGVPLMSNFHGLYSVGALAGSSFTTLVLALGARPLLPAAIGAAASVLAVAIAAPRLLKSTPGEAPGRFFVRPQGIVLFLGALNFVVFLVEGAMLDWSAVLLADHKEVAASRAGSGFTVFMLAMTLTRFLGDRVIAAFGERRVFLYGCVATAIGLALTLVPGTPVPSFVGFVLVGIGVANLVPILISVAGRQPGAVRGGAIAAVSMLGYTGSLAGPAFIGFAAHAIGLVQVFAVLGAAIAIVGALSLRVAPAPSTQAP